MQRSESIKALAKALVLAKSKMEAPAKNKKANVGREYHYADLEAVKKSYQGPLGEQGLFVTHTIAQADGHLVVTTTLIHAETGEYVASEFPMTAFAKPQEQGSALTYFKRYNVCALLDIVAEDDDDGAAAQNSTAKVPEKVQAKPSALTREEIEKVHSAAKKAGYTSVAQLAPILRGLCGVDKASDLSKSELDGVLTALTDMAQKVPA